MKALIVEDNKQIAQKMKDYLALEEIMADVVYDGEQGFGMATLRNYDIILLDLMLPGLDGYSFCKNLRKFKNTPIIITTAKGEIDDKLLGFKYGADDYLVKPFDMEELVARINAVTKRGLPSDMYYFKNIKIDTSRQEARIDNEVVHLTRKEYQIMHFLIKNRGMVVSRTDLIEEIWGDESIFDGDNKLDVYITYIRRKLGKEIIQTVKGYGYMIAPSER